ncbi:MAG: vitamin K epoxide reductase [Firmicutes bacterium]|nr:vitamin K epoxide reductase [Bacillota bacterium]
MGWRAWIIPSACSVLIAAASTATLLLLRHPGAVGCPGAAVNSVIDCRAVVTSQFGHVLGMPLGFWALVWLVGMWIWLWQSRRVPIPVWPVLGFLGVAYAIGSEIRLEHICVWCSMDQLGIVALALWSIVAGRNRRMRGV